MIEVILMMALQLTPNAAEPAASPAATAQAPPAKAKSAATDPNEVICKRQPVTGSRLIFEKICYTRAEWDQNGRVTQQQVETMTRSPVGVTQR